MSQARLQPRDRNHRLPLGPIAAAVVLVAGCGSPPPAEEEPPASPSPSELPAAALRGEKDYRKACRTCHGARGDGNGPRADRLDPRPTDFTRGVYRCRTTGSGVLPLDRDIYETIRVGVPGTTMPAFYGLFSAEARMDLVQYLKRLSPRFEKEAIDPKDILAIPPEPKPAEGSVDRGGEVYRKRCARCHGKDGRGDGAAGAGLKDDRGQPIAPTDFRSGTFRWGSDGGDIYRTVFTGLDGTPMRSFADSVEEEDRWPLVRFVESLRRPPGIVERVISERTE